MGSLLLKMLYGLRWLLLPFGLIHWGVVFLRNKGYDWRIFSNRPLERPVISIGNIQLGGTGKTPLTIALLEVLQREQVRVAVLTRGYKRKQSRGCIIIAGQNTKERHKPEELGDEPSMMLAHIRNGVLGVGANRYQVGKKILKDHPVDIFLLDDGFQHRKLHHDLDICLVDVSRWKNHPLLFPFSYLRDYRGSLKRADIIILTRFEQSPRAADRLQSYFSKKYRIPVWKGSFVVRQLYRLSDGQPIPPEQWKEKPVGAMCGIANPHHFWHMMEKSGLRIVYRRAFPDHHRFSGAEVEEVFRKTRSSGADLVIITEKDAVKLRNSLKSGKTLQEKIVVMEISFHLEEMPALVAKIQEIVHNFIH